MTRSMLNGRQPQAQPRHKSLESRMPGKLAHRLAGGRTEKDPRTAGTSPYGLLADLWPNLRLAELGGTPMRPGSKESGQLLPVWRVARVSQADHHGCCEVRFVADGWANARTVWL